MFLETFETLNLWTKTSQPSRFCLILNQSFLAQYSISIPPENVRKPKFSDVFRDYRNRTLDWIGLIHFVPNFPLFKCFPVFYSNFFYLCWSPAFILHACNFIKKRLQLRCISFLANSGPLSREQLLTKF